MNWLDLLLLNVVSFGGAWSIIYALTYVPYYGGDPAFSLLLTAPGILALLGIYYIFTTSMPRSGGDYVFMSRILHPSIALAANFVGYSAFLWFWIADGASLFSSAGLAQTFSVYGSLTGSAWATNLAGSFSVPMNNFLLGSVFILFFAAILIFRTRLYFWIQNIFMIIAVLGLVIIGVLLIGAAINPSGFVASFNSYATGVGAHLTPNAYQNLTASAGTLPDTSVSNITGNLVLVPFWFTVLFWVYVSNYLGGETKNARSTVKRALFGSFGIIFISTIVIFEAAYRGLGLGFITGANNIYYGYSANPFGGVLPQLTLFSAILANNPVLVLFLGVGIAAGFALVAPQSMLLMSRIMFSYSFDRVAPKGLADVNDRFHTPIKAILVAAIGAEVMLAFLSGILGGTNSYTALSLYTYAGLGTVALTFTFVAISAVLFPYRRKELYEVSSTVKRKVAGIPVITLLGIITLLYIVVGIGYYFYNNVFYTFGCPGGGAAGCDFNYFLIALPIAFIATMVYYFGVRWYRSKGGMPYDATFKEIPPE
jgi:basic amino acid/polyamine antiporter, APA family